MTREEIEAVALALPAATKVVQWGDHDVYKVGGKVFAVAGEENLGFKVTDIGFLALTETGVARQAPYMAKGQWVVVDRGTADAGEVTGWLAAAHALISAKLTKKARLELGLA